MSIGIHYEYIADCDNESCESMGREIFHSEFPNDMRKAVKYFRSIGWRTLHRGSTCPDCVEKHKERLKHE